jgi:hypothetical protein
VYSQMNEAVTPRSRLAGEIHALAARDNADVEQSG